jgi:hypothetical protein
MLGQVFAHLIFFARSGQAFPLWHKAQSATWTLNPFVCNDSRMSTLARAGRSTLAAALGGTLLVACTSAGTDAPAENVRPPKAGTPGQPSDVQGIYRSVRQGLLQLRGDGTIVLIAPQGGGPSGGRFTLQAGRLELQTDDCGDEIGSYDVVVTGEQEAGKATLRLTAIDDSCGPRLRDLTQDPWIYANS